MYSGIDPLTPTQAAQQEQQATTQSYIHRVLVALVSFINVLFFGAPDETISSRSARAAEQNKLWGILMSRVLDLFEADHGAKAQAADLERAEAVVTLEANSPGLLK